MLSFLRPMHRLMTVTKWCSVFRTVSSRHDDPPSVQHLSAEKYVEYRKEMLGGIKDWYPHKYQVTHKVGQVLQQYVDLQKEETKREDTVKVAGRIHSIRPAGKKLYFIDLIDHGDKKIQVKASSQEFTGEEQLNDWVGILRRGDVVGVEGFPCRTKAGELSVSARKVTLLAPCLRKMANPHVKLEEMNKRFRRRHVDFLANPEKKDIFRTRSRVMRQIRDFLEEHDFLEVETPILGLRYGGATARPFKTFHNEMEADLYLRIAPELHLKQLVVGGFDRVFEIGRQFRNEGVDTTHNPEFTTCEFYAAFADYYDVMSLTAKLLRRIVCHLFGEEMKVPYSVKGRPIVIDFKSKFNKYDFCLSLESAMGKQLPDLQDINNNDKAAFDYLFNLCVEAKINAQHANSCGKLLDKLFGSLVEPELVQPTFVTDYPQCLSPLAKPHRAKPYLCERFELYVAGRYPTRLFVANDTNVYTDFLFSELVNAYTELNNPMQQREMFARQSGKEAVNEDFVQALEYGLPPTAGFGLGIDRLVMILTNQTTIKEVLMFPLLKPLDGGSP